jgi:hypothetical protein
MHALHLSDELDESFYEAPARVPGDQGLVASRRVQQLLHHVNRVIAGIEQGHDPFGRFCWTGHRSRLCGGNTGKSVSGPQPWVKAAHLIIMGGFA